MAEINVPIVTIPQLHQNLQTLSATDLIPIVQGSEYDRDAAATLSEILASNPFQDQKEWKTFLLSAAALDTGTWTHNALVLLDAWESSISYSGTSIKNALMIVIPKWSAAQNDTTSCTFAETEGTTCQILRGNFLLIRFGLDGKISSYFSIPASSVDAIAQLKSLSVTNAVNAANVTATNAVNANAVNAANVTATSGVNANAVNATNVTATNAVNANAVNATNIVTATNVTATNAVNATNVTATGNVNAAGNIATSGNALVAGDFICAREIHDDTTIMDEATPGTRRLLYNIGDQPLNIQVKYLAAETDTAGTGMQYTLPARSGMEFVYLRSHPNTAGTYTCHEWGVVV